jgi:putative lipoprotein
MFRNVLLAMTVMLAAACSKPAETATSAEETKMTPDNTLMRVISGTVMYRERMMLPPGTQVIVVLEDQSRMDAPATEITRYTHNVDGGPPYPFRLVIDPRKIDDRMTYGLRARVENEGKLMFTSTEHIDPFALPAGESIEIMVTRTGGR